MAYQNLMRSATDRTLENQNEEEMQSLHGKIKALRSVSQRRERDTRDTGRGQSRGNWEYERESGVMDDYSQEVWGEQEQEIWKQRSVVESLTLICR